MARPTTPSTRRRSSRAPARGLRWMSERQLEAYLQTRETLRRLRAETVDAGPSSHTQSRPTA